MSRKKEKIPQISFILLDSEGSIQYTNLANKEIAMEYIKKFNIIKCLNKEIFIKKLAIDDYIVNIEKVIIAANLFFVVIIERKINIDNVMYKDYITGLYNRIYWEHIKCGIVKLPGVIGYSIILIDIDNLKKLNDTNGHIEGDRAIEIVGQAINESIRENDIAIHYGGDEFLIILPNTNKKGAEKVIQRIRKVIKIKRNNGQILVDISAGIAHSNNFNDLEKTVQMADRDMYAEKRKKQNISY